ncbi:MAG: hypothetical protein KGI47_06770 [Betaproteobacteria bacterium]|nr:hypothetical protein [Betaproteobacteria bacterium]MDE2623097.1 hypothetical protein [Betaproteobacteria bacterium]
MHKALHSQRGAVALIVAGVLVGLLAVVALAVDIGHLLVVRNQAQNAADAAALRGAAFLYTAGSNTPDFSSGGPAVTNASATVPLNIAVTANDTVTVSANYWNVLSPSAKSSDAAVQVSVTKQVPLYFAPVFGLHQSNVSASAIAIVQKPTAFGPGGVNMPLAIGACMYNLYWNSSTNQPMNDPATGQPYVFQISSSYGYGNPTCYSGQWTPLSGNQDNSDSSIQNAIAYGNSSTLKAGDSLWLQSGDENDLYNLVNNCSASGNRSCEYATAPVVTSIVTGSEQSITAMACLHILSATGGSGKYVTVQMSTGCAPKNASGSGVSYGVVGPPKLAQ